MSLIKVVLYVLRVKNMHAGSPSDPCGTAASEATVVGFKLSGHFKFFFDIINVRVTILDAKGLIK